MIKVEKFTHLPNHLELLYKATEILRQDSRVKGIYLSGSRKADQFSDIDLSIS